VRHPDATLGGQEVVGPHALHQERLAGLRPQAAHTVDAPGRDLMELAWLARRMGLARVGSSALLNVVGSASVGTRERVVVLEIGESWLVVGVGAGNVSALATLPKGEIPSSPAVPLPPFAARLQTLLDKNRGTR